VPDRLAGSIVSPRARLHPVPLSLIRPSLPAVLRGFAAVHGRRLETAAIQPENPRPHPPTLVFLHGAFGSLASWARFPRDVAHASRCPVLVYSRAGHGRSDPPAESARGDYVRAEAQAVLPALLDLHGIERPLLVGHEDGAAIALVHAGSDFDVAGVVALSPRSAVDDLAASVVRNALARLEDGDPMAGFARHHRDPAALLARYAGLWTRRDRGAPALEPFLARVTAPVVLMQGEDDEHASLADLALLARALPGDVQTLRLEAVGGMPWEDAPRGVTAAIVALADRVRAPRR
jgi:pimeloyl-ACP methyl ester carboxylesterase